MQIRRYPLEIYSKWNHYYFSGLVARQIGPDSSQLWANFTFTNKTNQCIDCFDKIMHLGERIVIYISAINFIPIIIYGWW